MRLKHVLLALGLAALSFGLFTSSRPPSSSAASAAPHDLSWGAVMGGFLSPAAGDMLGGDLPAPDVNPNDVEAAAPAPMPPPPDKPGRPKVTLGQMMQRPGHNMFGKGEGDEEPAPKGDEPGQGQLPLPAPKPATALVSGLVASARRLTLVVAGSQKCGTSAMAAYLASHPSVAFARTKEVHFFDVDQKWDRGVGAYDANWPRGGGKGLEFGVRAEATPYYIASHVACKRIAGTMGGEDDDYRLVLMIREPAARMWSE
jgi:hypothetical protein